LFNLDVCNIQGKCTQNKQGDTNVIHLNQQDTLSVLVFNLTATEPDTLLLLRRDNKEYNHHNTSFENVFTASSKWLIPQRYRAVPTGQVQTINLQALPIL
jgi:hypothetical protein